MAVFGHVDEEAPSGAVLLPGASVEVRFCRGRLAIRAGRIVEVRVSDRVPRGTVVAVEWDDDRSVSWLAPGSDIEVTPS